MNGREQTQAGSSQLNFHRHLGENKRLPEDRGHMFESRREKGCSSFCRLIRRWAERTCWTHTCQQWQNKGIQRKSRDEGHKDHLPTPNSWYCSLLWSFYGRPENIIIWCQRLRKALILGLCSNGWLWRLQQHKSLKIQIYKNVNLLIVKHVTSEVSLGKTQSHVFVVPSTCYAQNK